MKDFIARFQKALNDPSINAMRQELQKYNPTLHLVSQKDIERLDDIHFADSFLGSYSILEDIKNIEAQSLVEQNSPIHDLGSGNGFPGLILSFLASQRPVFLIERAPKKALFLESCAQHMKLSNTFIAPQAASIFCKKLPQNTPALFVCRAFASLKGTLSLLDDMAVGTRVYHFKSQNWEQELKRVTAHCWDTRPLKIYALPGTDRSTHLVVSVKK